MTTDESTRATMTNTTTKTTALTMTTAGATGPNQHPLSRERAGLLFVATLFAVGCGPTFDPASLIESTRVVGARIEVEGAPDRASPQPGETAAVTWLVTSPDTTPPLGWMFALCAPGTGPLACLAAPLARYEGTATLPRVAVSIPSAAALDGATTVTLYGAICAGDEAPPQFEAQTGLARCNGDAQAATVSLDVALQQGSEANHNPVAEHGFTFDGADWPALTAGADPCAQGLRVTAGAKGHLIGQVTESTDRETYTTVAGDPPAATATRERLQLSRFTTAGKLKSQFSFVEASDDSATSTAIVAWDAPVPAEVPAAGMTVTFTFVVRDDRGGTDWTTRQLCVAP